MRKSSILLLKNSFPLSLQKWKVSQTKIRVFSTLLFILFGCLIFVALPAVIFKHTEGWSALESIYFVVITLTTIGFGDFVAGEKGHLIFSLIYRLSFTFVPALESVYYSSASQMSTAGTGLPLACCYILCFTLRYMCSDCIWIPALCLMLPSVKPLLYPSILYHKSLEHIKTDMFLNNGKDVRQLILEWKLLITHLCLPCSYTFIKAI